MNYEIFLWLEPIAKELNHSTCLLICLGFVIVLLAGAGLGFKYGTDDDELSAKALAEKLFKGLKGCIVTFGIILILSLIAAPFADFTNIYKKTLIYRGINSTLADKTIQTADKGLDLLNAKIDKEIKLMKGEVKVEKK